MHIRLFVALVGSTLIGYSVQAQSAIGFNQAVTPVVNKSCAPCHNDRSAAGGLNLGPFTDPSSTTEQREGWERIIQKVRSGEMPPKGIPRPAAELDGMVKFIEAEFARADKNIKPDPGRVTAKRLNRNEYSNTIRDLLAIDFRAEKDFPTDDSGYGFDNIGDVLTISPILMEKYLTAAERIAARAIGADPLPKPLEAEYSKKNSNIRRLDRSNVEATHRIDFDGEYVVRFGFPGERASDAKPVEMGFWMDGKLLRTIQVETRPSGLVYFNPYSEEEIRIDLPEGDHVFRAGFINDEFVKKLDEKDAFSDKKNKFIGMITFLGPHASKGEKPSRKKILICDPKTGDVCAQKIIAELAHKAYRRPVTKTDTAPLMKFYRMAKAEGQSAEQGIQLAIQAMLVSPHFLFRIEHDAKPTDATAVHKITDVELAARLSYFLWSSMPDEELQRLAETGKLRTVLPAQIKRMMNDERASALASNFAGQWLEIRNLDSIKPDPQKFPTWTPELRDAMKTETRMFFEYMLRENRPLGEFIDAKFTFLNERLAKHYGIEGVEGPEFRRVELTNEQRGGILSHGSVLAVSSYPTRTSPVIRGKYILQNILGAPPPPPPPDVPALNEEQVGTAGSLRKQMEQHRTNAVCASCHNKMDVLGFGLENYDAIGRWRSKDGKFDLDVSGTFPTGKSFSTPAEMRTLLKEDTPQFARCITEKMLTYSLGRGLERYDKRAVDEIVAKMAKANYPFQSLVFEIVDSLPFQMRRGELITSEQKVKAKEIAQR